MVEFHYPAEQTYDPQTILFDMPTQGQTKCSRTGAVITMYRVSATVQ